MAGFGNVLEQQVHLVAVRDEVRGDSKGLIVATARVNEAKASRLVFSLFAGHVDAHPD